MNSVPNLHYPIQCILQLQHAEIIAFEGLSYTLSKIAFEGLSYTLSKMQMHQF